MIDAQTVRGGRAGPTFHNAGGRGGRTIGKTRSILVEILGLPPAVRVDPAKPHDVRVGREQVAGETIAAYSVPRHLPLACSPLGRELVTWTGPTPEHQIGPRSHGALPIPLLAARILVAMPRPRSRRKSNEEWGCAEMGCFVVVAFVVLYVAVWWVATHNGIDEDRAVWIAIIASVVIVWWLARAITSADRKKRADMFALYASQQAGRGREPFPPSLRFEVLKRDGFRCRYCGRSGAAGEVKLHVDHVVPVSRGGTNDMKNLVAACDECNLGKSNRLLDAAAKVGSHSPAPSSERTMTSIDPWKEPGDPLLGDAMMLTTEYRRVSASLLERRLYIGSAQAAHIIDQLEMLEYLGPFDGSDSRQVL